MGVAVVMAKRREAVLRDTAGTNKGMESIALVQHVAAAACSTVGEDGP